MHFIWHNTGVRVYFYLYSSDKKIFLLTLVLFQTKNTTLCVVTDFVIGHQCSIFWMNKGLIVYFYVWASLLKGTFKFFSYKKVLREKSTKVKKVLEVFFWKICCIQIKIYPQT